MKKLILDQHQFALALAAALRAAADNVEAAASSHPNGNVYLGGTVSTLNATLLRNDDDTYAVEWDCSNDMSVTGPVARENGLYPALTEILPYFAEPVMMSMLDRVSPYKPSAKRRTKSKR